ncbi:MAG: hypothetical protein IT260_03950 [Saprospiraceae bacterium]|nr:hypothetical protein [Saprospiraceae bacterium]
MNKLKITGYTDEGRGSQAGEPFDVVLNPEKVSVSSSITMNDATGGVSAPNSQVNRKENRNVSFEIMLDGTGVIPNSGDVGEKLTALRDVVWTQNDEIHRPNYLVLDWGPVFDGFKCMLQSMRVEYLLFDVDGNPLRAKVSLDFIEHENPVVKNEAATGRSPDMSRLHTVRVGDSLPYLCKEYYNKPHLYPAVAELNGLINFRNLEIGSQIYFPPIER